MKATRAKVVELNTRQTLRILTTRINKRVENGSETEKDVRELMSICYRYLHFHLSTAK